MCLCQRECRDFSTRDAWQIFLFLLLCPKQEQRLRDTDRLMRRNERSHISVPAPKQNRSTSVIRLRQAESAIFLRHLDSKRTDFRQSFEIFRWNFTSAIDFIRIDVFPQITFQFLHKFLASRAIFSALRWIWVNSIEIVATNKQIAGETAAVLERIARRFRQLERFPLAFRHLRR